MVIPNLLCSVSARPKRGKTHFSLTWPDPICVFAFDVKGVNEIVPKFPAKQIDVREYQIPIIDSDPPKPYAEAIWNRFNGEYREVCESGKYKTVVIDTATSLWTIIRHAVAEEVDAKRLIQRQYTLPNLRMNSVFSRAVIAGLNLVVIQYMKNKFVNEKDTGEEVLSGWKQTDGAVDVVLELDRLTRIVAGGKKETYIKAEIVDNRYDLALCGTELVNPTYDDLITVLGFGG